MSEESREQRWIELGAFWVSLALVVGLLIALVATEAPGANDEPLVTATITRLERAGDRLVVSFELKNQGERAATEVLVLIASPGGGPEVEQVVAHLPTGTVRKGVAVLYGVPAGQEPVARVIGYQEP